MQPRAALWSLARTTRSSEAQSTPTRPDTHRPSPNPDLPSSFSFNCQHSRRENPTLRRALDLDYGTRSENLDGANQPLKRCAIERYRPHVESLSRDLQ